MAPPRAVRKTSEWRYGAEASITNCTRDTARFWLTEHYTSLRAAAMD